MESVARSKNLDNTKWILTLLIVLYHIPQVDSNGGKIVLFVKNLGDCVVPAFAMISGFLFWRYVDSFEAVYAKMKRRVITLVVPYILWNLINTIWVNIKSVGLDGIGGVEIFNVNIVNNLIKWDSSPHFWYIFMLIFWTLLAPALYWIYKRKWGVALLFIVQMLYIICKGEGILHSRFIYILYTWGGFLGVYQADLINKITKWNKEKKIVIGGISLSAYFLLGLLTLGNIGMGVKVWIYAMRALFLITGIINMPLCTIGKKTQYRYAFWLFAIHYWMDGFVSMLVSRFLSGVLYQFITWFSVLSIGIFLGIFVDKVFPRSFKLLTGDRG